VKVVMTLLVRDEADVLEAHLAHHLSAGVDFVVATDHRSTDGTAEILQEYARTGYAHVIRREDERIRQSAWVTHMARIAAADHGADWVLNSDADEFWWPRAESLAAALGAVPDRIGIVYALSRSFVPRPGRGPFFERMTVRLAPSAPINDAASSFRSVAKVAHRAHPRVVVGQGNHRASGLPFAELRGWSPLEILHFPLRSSEQAAGKHETTARAWEWNPRGDLARAARLAGQEGRSRLYERLVVDEEALARGLADGTLVCDTRLRDALRTLRDGAGRFVDPHEGRLRLRLGPGPVAEDVARAIEASCLVEADAVRFQRRVDDLAARIALQARV
jgi:hypothetical protein